MAFCSKCGAQIPEGSGFCANCGTARGAADSVQGSYTAPSQGGYTAPSQGGYGAPQQSYSAPQQSYGAPQQNYGTPGSGMNTPKAKSGSKSMLIIIGAVAAAVILALISGVVLFRTVGSKGKSKDPNAGVYEAESASMWGMEIDVSDMYADGFSIELKDKGKCAFDIDGKKDKGKWELDGSSLHIKGGGMELNGTLEDGVMILEDVLDTGMEMTLLREGASAGSQKKSRGGLPAPGETEDEEEEEPEPREAEAELPPLKGTWWGWIEYSDSWGKDIEDKFLAAWCYIYADDESGRWYLEVYADGNSQHSVISMWLEDMEGSDVLLPDIGDEDAWILNKYLSEEDEELFSRSVSADGSLSFDYDYESRDGKGGCQVSIFLRPDGVLWDEGRDRLPPRYEEYKAKLEEED